MTEPTAVDVFDVCIVGAGPAGLAVAESLAGTNRSVCLLESGPPEGGPEQLDDVEIRAENPYPQSNIRETRAGMVGGTAGLWSFRLAGAGDDADAAGVGCRYLPLDPLDLEARPELGSPGWPLTRQDLDPWYAAAQRLCQLGPFDYNVSGWSDDRNPPLQLSGSGITSSMFQFGPATAFTVASRARIEAAPNISLRARSQALHLTLDATRRRVTSVRVLDAAGQEYSLRCRTVVLAAGTVENVRLVLDSRHDDGPAPGNQHDLVGRYFMEHPLVRGGLLVTDPADQLIGRLGLYATRQVRGTFVSAKLTLDEALLRREQLPACSALLVPRDASFGAPGLQAIARLRSPSGQRLSVSDRVGLGMAAMKNAPSVLRAVRTARGVQPNLDRATWATSESDQRLSVFEMVHQTEQSPDYSNRLQLAGGQDIHGRSKMALTWRWSEADQERIGRARDLFADAFERTRLGTVVQRDWDRGRPRMIGGTHHHLGGLRMATDPAEGVVDSDCKVHGTENLHVAGGAVFPSGGFANPTLTVVALGLRLGNRLVRQPDRDLQSEGL